MNIVIKNFKNKRKKNEAHSIHPRPRAILHRRNYIQSQEGRLIRGREFTRPQWDVSSLSLSPSLISGCTVIEHRSSLIMLSTKIDSIRTQTSPPSVSPPLATSSPRPPIRTLSARCLQSRRHNQYAKSSVQPSTDLVRTSPRKTFPKGNAFDFPSSNHDFLKL